MKRSFFYLCMAFLLVSLLVTGCSHYTGRTAGQHFDDAKIKAQIQTAIVRDPALSVLRTDVAVFQGNVTLSGQVPSREAEDRLVNIARSTSGVQSVRTNIIVTPPPK